MLRIVAGTGLLALGISDGRGHASARAVRSHVVVVLEELIEVALQLGQCACRVLIEPLLQGLVPTLDLALGLGMVGP